MGDSAIRIYNRQKELYKKIRETNMALMEMDMKLEVGKYYRTRDGRKVGPLGEFSKNTMHTGESDSRLWNLDGSRYYRNDPNSDLIAEWHNEPKQHGIGYTMTKGEIGLTGTLADLGVQVGDVVECVKAGYKTTITSYVDGSFYGTGIDHCAPYDEMAIFRLISRAQPKGPVITETVTTKRIVAGDYGRVRVNWCDGNETCFQLRGGHWTAAVKFSRDDLTAAIETLTAVRDAMPQNGNT